MGKFWEPWRPQVGDRVRIRLSAECKGEWRGVPVIPGAGPITDFDEHPSVLDGSVGTVTGLLADDSDGHPHLVEFDPPIPWRAGMHLKTVPLAAVELEPLETVNAD